MRRADVTQSAIFSYRTLEQRVPPTSHPLRKLRELVDDLLLTLHDDFAALYAKTGRPSIPPERLLRASLIQTLYSIRSERQLVQHIGPLNVKAKCEVTGRLCGRILKFSRST